MELKKPLLQKIIEAETEIIENAKPLVKETIKVAPKVLRENTQTIHEYNSRDQK